jgi:uncharacterized coiled-coil protein SlyX
VESNVGVGSTIELDGDTGIITATEFRGDGSNLSGVLTSLQNATDQGSTSNATIQLSNPDTSLVASGNVVISGNVTSLTFIGDGSQLTGVATNLQAITDNGNVTSNTVQFTNTGTSLTASGTIKAVAVQVNGLDVALDQDMTSNAGRVSVLETDLTSNVTRVTNLEAANVVQETLITNLRTDLDSNAVRVSSLETDRTSNTLRISVLESANIIQGDLLTDLRTDVTSNTGRIADLESANGVQETLITDLRTDLDSNVVRVSSLEADRTSNTSRISVLESANGVQETLITNLRTDMTSNTSRISVLETDLTDNVTRIADLESADVTHSSDISSLQSANTVQGGLITNLETATQYISATASGTVISSNLDVTGNIFMRGKKFIVESETKLINDAIIGIANNNTTSTTDVGILMQRPTANVALVHHGGTNDFTIGYTQNDLEATDITNDTTNEINVSVLGNLYTQNNLTVGNVVTASAFVGDGTGITGINLQQVAAVGHTTTTPLITSNTLTGKRTGAFDSKGDSTIEGEVFIDNLNAGEMTSQSISGTQDGSGITLTNPIVITYYGSNWLVNGQSWNDVFHFTFVEGLTYVFDISHTGTRVQTTGPHIGYFDITGDYNYGFNSTPYEFGVKRVGEQGYSGAQFRWTVPRGASSFQGEGGGSHPGPGYFYFMTKPITTGSTSPGNTTERRIRVIPNPDQHLLTGQTQIHGNLYSDSTIVSTNVEATDTITASDLVSSTRTLISNVATIGTTKTFVVTVSNTTGANKYYIDNELQPTIELHEHQTYIFDLSSTTLLTHPFVFQTTNSNDGTTNGTNHTTGITSTGVYGSTEKRTFVVPAGAPTTLYYYCTAHSGMGGQISISPTAELIVSGRVVASGNVEASKFIGDGSQLTGISGATTSDLQAVTTNGAITSDAIQFTNTGTSLAASGAVTAASVTATGGISAAYFTGDGSNVNIGEMTAETVPYVDSNKQLRDSYITHAPNKTIITSNLEVTGNIFVSGNSYSITSENTVINDRIIGLANNNTSTTLDVGLMLQYPQKNVAIIHHGTVSGSPHSGQLTVGYTQNTFVEDNVIHDANNITLNVIGHVVTQNNITVGAQGSYYGDGTTLTGVALEADLSDNVTRISALETATIISNSSGITTGFTKGDIIYASADNVLNKLAVGGTDGHVLKVTSATNKTLGWAAETGGGGGAGNTPWQTNGNKIHYSTDNVGINTSTPAFKLDVHGTANVGALTATSLSVGGQALALATDLAANASRINTLYTVTTGDIIYADGTNSLAKLTLGNPGDVLTVQGSLPVWVAPSGGSGGSGGGQWTTVNTNEIHYNGNVGIANTNPGHDLSVGSNLFVDDDGSNVLVVTGNTAMSSLTLGQVSIVASYGLNDILNASNTSSNIMQLTDATTGLVATGNVHALKFIGDGSELTNIASNLDQIVNNGNVTSNTVQFSNATTGLVTTANVEVGGELIMTGTGALTVPNGTTGDRPAATTGMIRYNTTTGFMEGYAAAGWAPIAQPPTVTGISPLTTLPSGGNVEGFFNQTELIHPNMPVLTSGDNAYNYFGKSVSMTSDGTRAIVGVPYDDIGAYSSYTESGSAQVFKRTGTTWTWEAEFVDQHVNQTSVTAVATTYDRFGTSVAISDDGIYAVVGAPADNAPGSLNDAGSAQIYIRSGTTWTHQQLLYSNSPTALDFFGISVSINSDGTRALIGATQEASTNTSAGSAEVWVRNTATNVWSYESNLTQATSSVDDHFGNSVRLSSDGVYAIVGAWKVSSGGDSENGEVVIFVRDTSTNNWTRQATFTINPQENWGAGSSRHGARFGHAVDINSDGTRVVVGAVNDYEAGGTNNGPRPGSADVWKRNTGESTWAFEARLDFPDTFTSSDSFGDSVSISLDGTRVAIGAPYHDRAVQNNTGAAYIFVRNTTTNAWTLKTSLYQTESEASALMGDSVALSGDGNYVLIGEPLKNITDLQNGSTAGTSAGKVGVYDFRSQVFDTSTQVFTATGTGIVSGSTVQLEGADGSLYSVSNVTPNAAGTQVTFKMGAPSGSGGATVYPDIDMTSASQGGYVVTAHTEGSGSEAMWKAFDGNSSSTYWKVDNGYSTSSSYSAVAISGVLPSFTDTAGTAHVGHWIQLELPNKIKLTRFVTAANFANQYFMKSYVVLGSNDNTNWTLLHSETNGTGVQDVTTLSGGSSSHFKYLKLLVKAKLNGSSAHLQVGEIEYYGVLDDGRFTVANQPYKVKVNSTSGLIGTSTAKIGFAVTWTTAVDANLSFDITASTTRTLAGTDGGGGTNRTFSLAPGSNALPSGLTLTGSTGAITGQIAANQDGVTTSVTFRLTDNNSGFFTDRAINIMGMSALYTMASPFTFTNAGATGRYGPTLYQLRTAYSPTWTDYTSNLNVTYQGIQEWTVPSSGTYRITMAGARGGTANNTKLGGDGRKLRFDVTLTKNEKLSLLIGVSSITTSSSNGGGGGGTFIVKSDGTILAAAGGGGGASGNNPSSNGRQHAPARSSNGAGNKGEGVAGGLGGINGGGGHGGGESSAPSGSNSSPADGTNGLNDQYAPGGAGFFGDGSGSNFSSYGTWDGGDEVSTGISPFFSGTSARGGLPNGAFGGGGGGNIGGAAQFGGSGGGGYSGGGGGASGGSPGDSPGGGGGSFINSSISSSLITIDALSSGTQHGYVTVEIL